MIDCFVSMVYPSFFEGHLKAAVFSVHGFIDLTLATLFVTKFYHPMIRGGSRIFRTLVKILMIDDDDVIANDDIIGDD